MNRIEDNMDPTETTPLEEFKIDEGFLFEGNFTIEDNTDLPDDTTDFSIEDNSDSSNDNTNFSTEDSPDPIALTVTHLQDSEVREIFNSSVSKKRSVGKNIIRIIYDGIKTTLGKVMICIIVGVIVAVVLVSTIFTKVTVVGNSMRPTYFDGDKVLVNKIASISRGDVVVAHESKNKFIIKRVVAVPGDTVQISNNVLFINGSYVKEDYVILDDTQEDKLNMDAITLDKDEYFLLGDNRGISKDSREIGPVLKDDIIGKVFD